MTTDFRQLASFIKKASPDEFGKLKAQHPGARILSLGRDLGDKTKRKGEPRAGEPAVAVEAPQPPSAADIAAAQDFCRVSLRVVRDGAEKLMKRVRAKIRSARRLRMGGAMLAMASSAGFAASTLDLIQVDQKITGLSFSGLAFLGAVAAFMSDEMSRGGPSGSDGRSLLDRLITLQGTIAGAAIRFEGEASTGVAAQFAALSDLDFAVKELTKLQSLYSVG